MRNCSRNKTGCSYCCCCSMTSNFSHGKCNKYFFLSSRISIFAHQDIPVWELFANNRSRPVRIILWSYRDIAFEAGHFIFGMPGELINLNILASTQIYRKRLNESVFRVCRFIVAHRYNIRVYTINNSYVYIILPIRFFVYNSGLPTRRCEIYRFFFFIFKLFFRYWFSVGSST